MKTRIIYFSSILVLFLVLTSLSIFGQTAASVTWYLDQVDTTYPNAIVGNLSAQSAAGSDSFSVAKYVTFTAQSTDPLPGDNYCTAWWPGKDASGNKIMWGNETAQNNYRFVQFVVSPKAGNSFNIDTISVYLAGGGTSYMRANLYYSTDPQFIVNNLLNPADTGLVLPHGSNVGVNQFAYKVNVNVASGQSLYFRIYPWYTATPSNSKYLYTHYAYISGTTSPTTDVKKSNDIPKVFSLAQNFPNPFNPTTIINFSLEKSGITNLAVYNMLGQKVADLINSNLSAGDHSVSFNAENLTSGIYIYQLTSGNKIFSRKMILLK